MKNRIQKLLELSDYSNKLYRLDEMNIRINDINFWQDSKIAANILKEKKIIEDRINELNDIQSDYKNMQEMSEIEEFKNEYETEYEKLERKLDELEFALILSDNDDIENAILTIHSGAGGSEACDWVQILFRMYSMYCKNMNYNVEILDEQEGDVAGIKSITFSVNGKYAYGYLKAEMGVHRLIRNSPFDSNNSRHTSFASVDVLPNIQNDIEIILNNDDLRYDYFRGSGAGGQHRNKTDSAVRITHLPTGMVAQCQNERSQGQNKEIAFKMLKMRIYEAEKQKIMEQKRVTDGKKSRIDFGSQIRTYTFQPYQLVKDHRTNMETGNIQNFLDGDIQPFIMEYLKNDQH
jgi:peptide chain release factor 2